MVKLKTLVPVILVMGIAAGFVSGMERPAADANTPETLQEYLQYAALHNAALQAVFQQWKAALEQIPQAKALPDPRFNYGYFIEEVETRVGPQQQRAGIVQVFPWFGTIAARTDAAAAEAKAAGQHFEAAKLQLFYQVKDAFYEYLYLRRAIQIAEENLELIRHFEEVARAKYITAAAGHPDIIRAQVQLAIIEDRLKESQELRAPLVARLNAVLNRPTGAPLPWPKRQEMPPVDIERARLFDLLKRQNPQLEAKEFELAGAVSRIDLATKKFYPEIGVGADWIDTEEAVMPGVRDSGKDPVILMFSMNLPIWRKSYKAAELQARAVARRVRHEREDLENTLTAQTARVLYGFEDSGRKLRLYGDVLVPRAEELVGASESAYSAGAVDFLSLIDAQQTLLRFQLERERAWANHQQRLAELEMLVGADLSQTQPAQQEN
jgi:cobalt-zinc-cadmium efflux system outer membrane protein